MITTRRQYSVRITNPDGTVDRSGWAGGTIGDGLREYRVFTKMARLAGQRAELVSLTAEYDTRTKETRTRVGIVLKTPRSRTAMVGNKPAPKGSRWSALSFNN